MVWVAHLERIVIFVVGPFAQCGRCHRLLARRNALPGQQIGLLVPLRLDVLDVLGKCVYKRRRKKKKRTFQTKKKKKKKKKRRKTQKRRCKERERR